MKLSKKILAVVLTVLMVVSVLPFSAFAATSGSCGTNATYTLQDTDEDSILDKLTISGTGAMADYTSGGAPWYSYSERQNLKTVVIEEGITSVGNYAFFNLDHAISLSIASTVETLGTSSFQYYGYYSTNVLTNVTLPDALTNIGDRAFAGWQSLQSVTIPAGVTSIGSQTFAGCSALSTVTFARPSTSHNLAVGVNAFSSGSIAFSGTGADLYDGETEITAGTAASSLGGKTLNWVSTTPTTGFMVGSDHFDDFEEAVAAAKAGSVKTITFLSDVDYTNYPRVTYHDINLSGLTVDLNGHTIVGHNHSVVYSGDNFTIKNGYMSCVSDPNYKTQPNNAYGVVIYPEEYDEDDNVSNRSTGVVLEDLVVDAGVNIWDSDVTLKNLTVSGKTYYGIWADDGANVTVEGGTYTSECSSTNGVIGVSTTADYQGNIVIEDGDFTVPAGKNLILSSTLNSSTQLVEISGGTYNVVVPAKVCADNFVPVTEPNAQGKYVVEEATTGVILNGVNYETLEEAIAAANDGDTITFVSDLTGNGIVVPKDKFATKGLTIDFKGHTYTCNENYVGSTGTQRQVFQLNEGNKINFKNGTIESEGARMLIQNYSNLTLDNMTLDHQGHTAFADKTPYALSNNNGTVVIKDTTINACDDGFAFDACRYAAYTSVNVTVTGDSVINGNVELSASANDAKDGLSVNFVSGTLNGEVVLDPSAETAMNSTPAKAFVQKASTFVAAPPVGYMWDDETGKLVPSTAEDAYSITANDNIDLNFYIETETSDVDHLVITHSDPAKDNGSTITVTKPVATLETYVVPATATEPAKEYKVYKVNLAPAQLKDNIKISVYEDATNVQRVIETSVDEYCRTILSMDDAALGAKATELKGLAKSTLDYGKAASAYFEYNDSAFAGVANELAEPDLNDERLYVAPGSNYAGISITGVSYVATTVPELRFTIDSSISENYLTELNETIETNIGEAKFVKVVEGGQVRRLLQITNIDITDFGKQIVVTAGGDTILRFVPLTWAKSAAKSTTNAKVAALGKSICNYYINSVEYFGIKA